MNSGEPTLRIGVVGAGFIAQVAHLHAFAGLPGVKLAALAEPHGALREAVADRHGIARRFADHRALLDDPHIDAVIVSMPRRAQAGIVAEALAAGPAVLSEKPVAMTLAEAGRLLDLAEGADRHWQVGYMKRFDPGVLAFRDLLAETRAGGRLGGIVGAEMRDFCRTYGVPIPPHLRRSGARPVRYPEGPLAPEGVPPEARLDYEYTVNVASHDVNLLRFLFPEPLAALSFRARRGGLQRALIGAGAFDIALALGPADVGGWDQRLDVTFERGRLSLVLPSPLDRQRAAEIRIRENGACERRIVSPSAFVWCFEAQARAFAGACAARRAGAPSSRPDVLPDAALIENLWNMVDWQQ